MISNRFNVENIYAPHISFTTMDRVYQVSRAIVQFVNRYEKNERNARDK